MDVFDKSRFQGKDKWEHAQYSVGCNYLFLPSMPAFAIYMDVQLILQC